MRKQVVGMAGAALTLPDVCLQDVYADLSNNLLLHVMVPALGLRSKEWTVVSWARSQTAKESLLDAKYVYRYAQLVQYLVHNRALCGTKQAMWHRHFTWCDAIRLNDS